jgi:hypothetical protein
LSRKPWNVPEALEDLCEERKTPSQLPQRFNRLFDDLFALRERSGSCMDVAEAEKIFAAVVGTFRSPPRPFFRLRDGFSGFATVPATDGTLIYSGG